MFKQLVIVPRTRITPELVVSFGFYSRRNWYAGVRLSGRRVRLWAGFDRYTRPHIKTGRTWEFHGGRFVAS